MNPVATKQVINQIPAPKIDGPTIWESGAIAAPSHLEPRAQPTTNAKPIANRIPFAVNVRMVRRKTSMPS